MIATWMLAATALGLLAGGTALATERVFRLLGRQGRHVWVLALVVTCTWPLLAPVLARPLIQSATELVTISEVQTSAIGAAAPIVDSPSVQERLAALDTPLMVLWAGVAVLLLARALLGLISLHRIAQSAEQRTVVGRAVLITSSVGPAAFGIVRPRIVLPRWSLELDTPMRELVVRHEAEHVKSADPAVLTVAWLLVALFPWNASLWWIVRRLRTATELDCDHRVVRAGADRRRYAHVLLLIAQRQGEMAFASMIAGAPTTLLLRIAAMHGAPPARRTVGAAVLALIALALGAVTASPVLARELASVRAWMPTAPGAGNVSITRSFPAQPVGAMSTAAAVRTVVLSPVRVVAVRTLTPPAPLEQDTATRLTRQVVRWGRTSAPMPSKGVTTVPSDAPVVPAPGSSAPRYPWSLKEAGVNGVTVVRFVIDTTGSPIPSTLTVVRSSHALFTEAVQRNLAGLRFLPARADARNVKQLAQMVFRFQVLGIPVTDTLPVPAESLPTFTMVVTAIIPPR